MQTTNGMPTLTQLGLAVLRVRLSLGETQVQFTRHFHCSLKTITNWENGTTTFMQPIYLEILKRLQQQLVAKGALLGEEAVLNILQRRWAKWPRRPEPRPPYGDQWTSA